MHNTIVTYITKVNSVIKITVLLVVLGFCQNKISGSIDLTKNSYQENLKEAQDSVYYYLKLIESNGITREKLEFNKIFNADTVLKTIQLIRMNYKKVNLEYCIDYYVQLTQYYGQLLYYDLYEKCIAVQLPVLTNKELFSCKRKDIEVLVKIKNLQYEKCNLYYVYWGMIRAKNSGEFYNTLIKKTIHDPCFKFYIYHRDTIKSGLYPANVFTNYDVVLDKFNNLDDEYRERFFRLADLMILSMRSSIINKYRTFLSLEKENTDDKKVDSLYAMLTSKPTQTFIEYYLKYTIDNKKEAMVMEKIRKFIKDEKNSN